MEDVGFMIGPNGMVGYDIVLGRVTYSYGKHSPGTYNWNVAGYINEYGETYSSTSVNNSDYDSCGCISHKEKNSLFALRTSATTTTLRSTFIRMVVSSATIGLSRIPTGGDNSPDLTANNGAHQVEESGVVYDVSWGVPVVTGFHGKMNHSYQIQVRALKFDKTNSLQFYSAVSKWSINV